MPSFNDLPPEIREQIFQLIFLRPSGIRLASNSGKWRGTMCGPGARDVRIHPHSGGHGYCFWAISLLLHLKCPQWIAHGYPKPMAPSLILATPELDSYVPFQQGNCHAQLLRVCRTWHQEAQWIFRSGIELLVLPSPLKLVVPEIEEHEEFTIHLPWKIEDLRLLKDQVGGRNLSGVQKVTMDVIGVAMSTWQPHDHVQRQQILDKRVEVVVERYLKPLTTGFVEALPSLRVLHLIRKAYTTGEGMYRDRCCHVQQVGAYVKTMVIYWIDNLPELREVKILEDRTDSHVSSVTCIPQLQIDLQRIINARLGVHESMGKNTSNS